jgi:hypothetical protein
MRAVYVVQHSHPTPWGEDETKFIGVFGTKRFASNAVRRLRKQPGFKRWPKHFFIDACLVNSTSWSEGFITVRRRRVKVRKRAR